MPRLLPCLALLLVAHAITPSATRALVMCAKTKTSTGEIREGTPIRLRSTCKPKEVEIDPVALGLQGPPGQDGLPGADGQNGIACWDVNGNSACDPEEDTAPPAGCDALDCRGLDGAIGNCEVASLYAGSPPGWRTGDVACGFLGKACLLVTESLAVSPGNTAIRNPLLSCDENPTFGNAVCCG